MTLKLLDRIFIVIFARRRRKSNDSNLRAAWLSASNSVSGYLAIPIASIVFLSMATIYLFIQIGTPAEHQVWGEIGAGTIAVVIATILNRRFKKFLASPPTMSGDETRSKAHLVWCFRAFSVGLVLIAWLLGTLLRRAGLMFVQGL